MGYILRMSTQLDVRGKPVPETVGHRSLVGAAWINQVVNIIRKLAIAHREFTTDEVWAEIDASAKAIKVPFEPRVLGIAMKKAQTLAWIDKTNKVRKSTRPACHGRSVTIWKSCLTTRK